MYHKNLYKKTNWRKPSNAPRIGNNPLIFSSPELQSLKARTLWHITTAAVWILGLYLLTPISILVLWLVNSLLGYTQLLANDVYFETIKELKLYSLIIIGIGAILLTKLVMNIAVERYVLKTRPIQTDKQLLSGSINALTVQSRFKTQTIYKRMLAHHDDSGHLIYIDNLDPLLPSISGVTLPFTSPIHKLLRT